MKKYLRYVLWVVLAGMVIYLLYTYDSFSRKGLDTWLVGQTDGDHYPDWGKDAEVVEADYSILKKVHLFFSRIYLIKCSNSYQLRFRIAYSFPFLHSNLFENTEWVKLTDSHGNDYLDCLTVYPSEIAGLNCINVMLLMDESTFSSILGDKLTVSVVCTESDLNDESSYANCEVEILIPEID